MRCPSCFSQVEIGAHVQLVRCTACNTKFMADEALPDEDVLGIGELPPELTGDIPMPVAAAPLRPLATTEPDFDPSALREDTISEGPTGNGAKSPVGAVGAKPPAPARPTPPQAPVSADAAAKAAAARAAAARAAKAPAAPPAPAAAKPPAPPAAARPVTNPPAGPAPIPIAPAQVPTAVPAPRPAAAPAKPAAPPAAKPAAPAAKPAAPVAKPAAPVAKPAAPAPRPAAPPPKPAAPPARNPAASPPAAAARPAPSSAAKSPGAEAARPPIPPKPAAPAPPPDAAPLEEEGAAPVFGLAPGETLAGDEPSRDLFANPDSKQVKAAPRTGLFANPRDEPPPAQPGEVFDDAFDASASTHAPEGAEPGLGATLYHEDKLLVTKVEVTADEEEIDIPIVSGTPAPQPFLEGDDEPVLTTQAAEASAPVADDLAPAPARSGRALALVGYAVVAVLGLGAVGLGVVFAPTIIAMVTGGAEPKATPLPTPAPTEVGQVTPEPTQEATPETTRAVTPATPRPTQVAVVTQPRPTPTRRTTPRPTSTPSNVSTMDLEFETAKADAFYAEGKLKPARKQYEKVIGMNSRYGPAHLGLARVLEKSGDKAGACREYRLFLNISPAGKGSAEAGRKAAACK